MTKTPAPQDPPVQNPGSSPEVTTQTPSTGKPAKAGALDRFPVDPAWIAIGVAGLVLVGATLSVMRGDDAPPEPLGATTPTEVVAPAVVPEPLAELRVRMEAAEAEATAAASRLVVLQQGIATREAEVQAQSATVAQEINMLRETVAQREAQAQALAERIAPLEAAASRLEATEARIARLTALNALKASLDAGQPLGPALADMSGEAPTPLARYSDTAPPTEPGLRLSFEEAVRAARAQVADTQPRGLGSLFTIRRGEDVIWGDENEATLERARRALTAGDLPGTLTYLANLPGGHREAMADWIADARALVAARVALRNLMEG
jgi:hypothetical protein